MRENCTRCGMIANLDPSEHTDRYGHKPAGRRADGDEYEFDFCTYAFTKDISARPGVSA